MLQKSTIPPIMKTGNAHIQSKCCSFFKRLLNHHRLSSTCKKIAQSLVDWHGRIYLSNSLRRSPCNVGVTLWTTRVTNYNVIKRYHIIKIEYSNFSSRSDVELMQHMIINTTSATFKKCILTEQMPSGELWQESAKKPSGFEQRYSRRHPTPSAHRTVKTSTR